MWLKQRVQTYQLRSKTDLSLVLQQQLATDTQGKKNTRTQQTLLYAFNFWQKAIKLMDSAPVVVFGQFKLPMDLSFLAI